MLKPRDTVVRSPAAHNEGTVSGEWMCHATDVSIVDIRFISGASLSQSELVACVSKFNLHMEWSSSVDLLTGSENTLLLKISGGLATSVAAVVVWTVSWAGVWSSSPGVLVGLHDIELWAPFSCDVVGVTVVVAVGVVGISIRANCWEGNGIECGDASASSRTEINVILNRSIEEIWFEEPMWVKRWGLGECSPGVVRTVKITSIGATLWSQIESLVFTIYLDLKRIEPIDSLVTKMWVPEFLLGLNHAQTSECES